MAKIIKIFPLAVALALLTAGCTGKQEPPTSSTPVPIASEEAVKKPNLRSAHAAKVEAALYPEQKPSGPVDFVWNFSKGGESTYELTQTIESSIGPSAEKAMNRAVTINGKISLIPVAADTGRVVFKEMTAAHEMIDEKGQNKRAIGPMQPPSPFDIAPDTTGADPMTLLMMPIPGKKLKPGDSVSVAITLPLRAGGAGIPVPALLTVTYAGDARRGPLTLARLDTSVTLGDFSPPKDDHGEYQVAVGGTGRAYFDPATGRLFESWTALRFTLEGKQERRVGADRKQPAVKEFDTIHMDSDNFFRIIRE